MLRLSVFVLLAAGCSGEEVEKSSFSEWACVNIAAGDIQDVSVSPEDAPVLEVGTRSYRLNMNPAGASFVSFQWDGGSAMIATDAAGALVEISGANGPVDFTVEAHSGCPDDLPETTRVTLNAGTYTVELGPLYVANLWFAVGKDT